MSFDQFWTIIVAVWVGSLVLSQIAAVIFSVIAGIVVEWRKINEEKEDK